MGNVCGFIMTFANSGLLLWRGVRKVCFLHNTLVVVEKWWKSLCGSLWETMWESLKGIVENEVLHMIGVEKLSFARGSGKVLHGVLHMILQRSGDVLHSFHSPYYNYYYLYRGMGK